MKKFPKILATILLIMGSITTLFAQKGEVVRGSVVDSGGEPIIGANIIEKGNSLNGTVTDLDGAFNLKLSLDNSSLEVSYIGFATQELVVGSRSFISITLDDDATAFDEVIVVGYGVQKKKLITGATAQVSGEDVNEMGTNGTLTGLQSKVTGVTIGAANGQPGESEDIVIRGIGTIGDSSPLYVIDGVAGASMDMLNPSDIESIDILKDAASAAIYGSRAANGVVLITTKKGKSDHFELRYDGYYAIQNVAKMVETLNAQEYIEIMDESQTYLTGSGYDWQSLLPSEIYSSVMDGSWTGTNWLEEIVNPNAPKQSHAITMSGGNDRSTFSAGYSYLEQEGTIGAPCEPTFVRHNARLNIDNTMYKVGDLEILKFGATMMYSYSEKNGVASTTQHKSTIKDMLVACPLLPVYNSEGGYYDMNDRESEGWSVYNSLTNPIGVMVDTNQAVTTYHRYFANTYFELQPIKNLRIRSAFGYKLHAYHERDFVPTYYYSLTDQSSAELVTQKSGFNAGWTLDNTMSYNFTYKNDHNFDIILGQSIEKSGIGVSQSGTNTGLSLDHSYDYAYLSNTSGVDSSYTSLSGTTAVNSVLSSLFGRVNYNYKETYMFTAMMRADASSKFADGYRWGYFPSVSVGWVVSNEDFLSSSSTVDFLKLRVSWGQNGNCNISNFAYSASIDFPENASYYFGGDNVTNIFQGAYMTTLANEDVTWETSEQLNFGVDASFLRSRLGLTLDLYSKYTRDWLVEVPVLSSYGADAAYDNAGCIRNRGVELGLSWRDSKGDFSYSVNLNGTYNENEVTEINNGNGYIDGSSSVFRTGSTEIMYRAQEGMPVGYFFGYKTLGVFQNEEQVANTEAKMAASGVGDLIFADLNGDGQITDDDRTMIGNPIPDVVLGLNISLAYKGFDLSIVANGEFGQQVFQSYRTNDIVGLANFTKNVVENRWHGEGTSNTIPCLVNDYNWDYASDMYVQDADFVKIQNITLGYNINRVWKSSPLKRLRLYVSLQNYITITGYDGFDPDVNYKGPDGWSSGIDFGNYPISKMCIFGTNITF